MWADVHHRFSENHRLEKTAHNGIEKADGFMGWGQVIVARIYDRFCQYATIKEEACRDRAEMRIRFSAIAKDQIDAEPFPIVTILLNNRTAHHEKFGFVGVMLVL